MSAKSTSQVPRLVVSALLLIVSTWLAAGLATLNARQAAHTFAERDLAGLTRLLTEHADRAIQSVDLVAGEIADQVGELPPAQRADGAAMQRLARSLLTGMPQARAAIILDETGRSIGDSEAAVPRPFNGADREYFRVHARRDDVGLFIGPPVKSRINGLWAISLSRRINGPDGRFAGVVTVALDPMHFASLYSAIDPDLEHAIALIGRDGTIRAAHPFADSSLGQSMTGRPLFQELLAGAPTGVLRTERHDGRAQLTAYRVSSTYPIVLSAGRAVAAIDAEWRNPALMAMGAASALTIMIVACLLLIRAGWRRTDALNVALIAERYRADHAATAKARLLGVLGEDFRTSLSAASIFVDLMLRGVAMPGSRRHADYLGRTQTILQQLLARIEQLIDHVRIQAGEIRPARTEIDPSRALAAVLPMVEPEARVQGLRLKLPEARTPFLLFGDDRRLRELLFDLLANAIRATPHDGRVRLRFALLGDGAATIVVQHSGPRIDAAELALRLKPATSPDSTVVPPLPGPWRDLALACATAELLGARLAIESTEHRGTRVTVTFPPEQVMPLATTQGEASASREAATA